MKLLIDMNLSPKWARYLIDAGFEAIHWSEVGPNSASDTDVMRWSVQHGYVVLTCDLDFGAILAATQALRPSVIQIRSDLLTTEAAGPAVLSALDRGREELSTGAIMSIDAGRARLRILPLS